MAKKRNNRNGANAAAAARGAATQHSGNKNADANAVPRPLLAVSPATMTAHDALTAALSRLDTIAQEAHAYTQQMKQAQRTGAAAPPTLSSSSSPATAGSKRTREDENDGATASSFSGAAAKASEHTSAAAAALAAAASSTRLDVFAATSALQYRTLTNTIAALGLQLLPSLDEMSKRVTLAVLTPALSTPEAWETMAVLATTYRAGMAHAVHDLMESLLREPGVLLLDAPQLVPAWFAETFIHVVPSACAANSATAALGGLVTFAEDQQMRYTAAAAAAASGGDQISMQYFSRLHTERVDRKLRALITILYACGAYVPASTLQQFALRHVLEVVEGGVLPCYQSALEAGQENVATFHAASQAAAANKATEAAASATAAGGDGASTILRWRVPAAWHAACVELVEALLLLMRPAVPAQLLASAAAVMEVVARRLHRGVPVFTPESGADSVAVEGGAMMEPPPLPVTHAVNAAVVRLGHTLHLLRHPVVLAPYQPPQITMEKAKWRVLCVESATALDGGHAETRSAAPDTPAPTAEAQLRDAAPQPAVASAAATETKAPTVQQQQQQQQRGTLPAASAPSPPAVPKAKAVTAVPPVESARAPPPKQQQPVRPVAPPPPRPAEEEEDDVPDIVLDD